jgi:hypothetical protein
MISTQLINQGKQTTLVNHKRSRAERTKIPLIPSHIHWIKDGHHARSQNVYDRVSPHRRVMKKLWNKASLVRITRPSSQAMLERGCDALSVKGVIYAIFCWKTFRIYIGQSINSTVHRFEQHVREARAGDTEPLHAAIRKFGFRSFVPFVLEKIDSNCYTTLKDFQKLANPRERYWINRLHTGHKSRGWNVQHAHNSRRRHPETHNPMARKRNPDISRSAEIVVKPLLPLNGKRKRAFGYRNWDRRCRHLLQLILAKRESEINLKSYKLKVLWSMLRFLEGGGILFPYSLDTVELVTTFLRGFLCTRKTYSTPRKTLPEFMLKLHFNSNRMQRMGIRRVFKDPEIAKLLPEGVVKFGDDLLICNKLVQPIGSTIFNFSGVARSLSHETDKKKACNCHTLFPSCALRDGHVFTGDLDHIPAQLRKLFEYGPQFREGEGLQKSIAGLDFSLAGLVGEVALASNLERSNFEVWSKAVLQKCTSFLSSRVEPHPAILGKARVKSKLSWLQRHLVFVPTDKASNNIGSICKNYYVARLKAELQSGTGVYEICTDTPEVILKRISDELKRLELKALEKWAYLYMMPKLHKDGARFIAGGRQCVTTEASKILTGLLKAVLATLRTEDDVLIRTKGYKRCFVVDGYEEVALALKAIRVIDPVLGDILSGDFKTMYTTLPHDDLIKRVSALVDIAYNYEKSTRKVSRNLFLVGNSNNEFSWRRAQNTSYEPGSLVYSMEDVKFLIHFIVSNTFVMNGAVLRRQILGIPMGTNCAPLLANLYLLSYERDHMDGVWAVDQAKARNMRSCFRLIDDLLTVNCPGAETFLSDVYPKELTLERTNARNDEACFLGMKLNLIAGESKLHLDVFDKRKEFPFRIRNYPHMDSVIPKSQAYGVFTGQLHRFHRICTAWKDFVKWAVDVASYMSTERGYSKAVLGDKFERFCNRDGLCFQGVKPRKIVADFKQKLSAC